MSGPVLLVDDGSPALRELRIVVGKLQIDASYALSGPHALHLADEKPPQLALTDLFVPGLDGLSLTRQLEARGIETVILSATAPAFPPGAAPKAQVLLRDESWRPAVLARLLAHAGAVSKSTEAELRAWSDGREMVKQDASAKRSSEPAPQKAPPLTPEVLGALANRIAAVPSSSEIVSLLLPALEGQAPETLEPWLMSLHQHTRREVRSASFQASAALGAASHLPDFLTRAAADEQLPFVLLGACTRGPMGCTLLAALTDLPGAPTPIRVKALAVWDQRASREQARPHLLRWVTDATPEVAAAALKRLGARDLDVLVDLLSMTRLSAETRAASLLELGLCAPRPSFDQAIEIATRDPSQKVRAAAYEVGIKRLGARSGPLLARLAQDEAPSSAFAALAGAMDLGEAGYGVLTAMMASPLPPEVQRDLQLVLHRHFGVGSAPVEDHDHLVADLKEELVPTRPEAPADFVGPENIDEDFFTGPTEPRRPARETRTPEPKASAPEPIPAVPSGPKKRAKSRAEKPATEPGPSPRELRAELDAAEALGRSGFAVVVEVARERLAPPDLRARAVRHLGTELFGPEAVRVLDELLFDEAPSVQNAALGVFMNADTQWLDRFLRVAGSPHVTAKVRARAVRHIGSRFSREETTEALEAFFSDGSALVRRAALEGLFPTLRNLHGPALDEGLLNLMTHHVSAEVRASASRALTAFGSEAAIASARGWFRSG